MSGLGASSVSRDPLREWSTSATGDWILAPVARGSVAASVVVAYAAAVNPYATPVALGGWLAWTAYVFAPPAVCVYAWHLHPEEPSGRLLVVFAATAALWTLTGSGDRALFGMAEVVGVFVAAPLSCVALSFPDRVLRSQLEGRVVAGTGAGIAACWWRSLCVGQFAFGDWV